jgi:hypothetical protein
MNCEKCGKVKEEDICPLCADCCLNEIKKLDDLVFERLTENDK